MVPWAVSSTFMNMLQRAPFLGGHVTTKATSAETGGAYALAEHHVTPAANPPLHVHHDEDEGFYVLEGELEVECGGTTAVARAGDFALLPRGVPHTYRVLGESARMLVLSGPGFERFVDAVQGDAPAPEHVVAAAAANGIAFV